MEQAPSTTEPTLRTLTYSNLRALKQFSDRPLTADSGRDLAQAYDRFKLWIANVGALQSGSQSIDERLTKLEHVFNFIRKLLVSLQEVLQDIARQRADPRLLNDPDEVYEEIGIALDTITNLMKATRLVPSDSSTEEHLAFMVDSAAQETQQAPIGREETPKKPPASSAAPKRHNALRASTPPISQQPLWTLKDK